jgi:hypothetical protein
MLVVKKATNDTQGTWMKRIIWGAEVEMQIRPLTKDVSKTIRSRHVTGFEYVPDANGRRLRQEVVDAEKIVEDTLDYMLQDFRGIGDAPDQPWPVDLDHKKDLANLPVEAGQQTNMEWLFERAKELAFEISKDLEVREKNS